MAEPDETSRDSDPAESAEPRESAGPTGDDTPAGAHPAAVAADLISPATSGAETTEKTEDLAEEVGEKDPPRKAAVIYNPIKTDLDALRTVVEAAEDSADYEPTVWLETAEDDPGVAMAEEAVAQGCSVVIAAGGDGTVRAVVEGLADSSVSLALVPAGTGNLLARNLRLPLNDLEGLMAIAFAGHDHRIDVGEVETRDADGATEKRLFVVAAGIGLDAQMIVHTDEDLKAKAGWLAYVQAIWKAMRGGARLRIRTTRDDEEPQVSRVHTLLVGNCGQLPGDVVMLPEAELDDGALDVVALRPEGLWGWLTIWARVLVQHKLMRRSEIGRRLVSGAAGGSPGKAVRALRYENARRLRVQIAEPEPLQLDGDLLGEVVEFTTTIRPQSLTVRLPDDEVR